MPAVRIRNHTGGELPRGYLRLTPTEPRPSRRRSRKLHPLMTAKCDFDPLLQFGEDAVRLPSCRTQSWRVPSPPACAERVSIDLPLRTEWRARHLQQPHIYRRRCLRRRAGRRLDYRITSRFLSDRAAGTAGGESGRRDAGRHRDLYRSSFHVRRFHPADLRLVW